MSGDTIPFNPPSNPLLFPDFVNPSITSVFYFFFLTWDPSLLSLLLVSASGAWLMSQYSVSIEHRWSTNYRLIAFALTKLAFLIRHWPMHSGIKTSFVCCRCITSRPIIFYISTDRYFIGPYRSTLSHPKHPAFTFISVIFFHIALIQQFLGKLFPNFWNPNLLCFLHF